MALSTALLATALFAIGAAPDGATRAEASATAAVVKKPAPYSAWSTDLLDPEGLTRFHLVARSTFADGSSAFSGASAWSLEPRVHLDLAPGIALAAVLPLGITAGRSDTATEVFLGNIGLGISVGGPVTSGSGLRVKLGGGFDTYLPTAAQPDQDTVTIARSTVAAIRGYEPQLYVPKMLSFRLRGLAELAVDRLSAQLEVGVVPGFTVGNDKASVLLVGVAGRVSAAVIDEVEPYLEVGTTTQLAGDGQISPPLLVTPGLRLHLAEVFDPAIFVSFNFVEPSAIVLGLDLASAIRSDEVESKHKRSKERDDFLGDF